MSSPPRPDRIPGKIKTRPPKGKPEERPLERIHQEFEAHKRQRRSGAARKGASPRANKAG